MIPFLHLGPLTIPTFGLMVATGMLLAAYVLQADFNRRRDQLQKYASPKNTGPEVAKDEGFLIMGIAGLAVGMAMRGLRPVRGACAATMRLRVPPDPRRIHHQLRQYGDGARRTAQGRGCDSQSAGRG